MKPSRFLLPCVLALLAALVPAGCGPNEGAREELRRIRAEVRELERRSARLRGSLDSLKDRLQRAGERCRDRADRLGAELERLQARAREYRGLAARHESLENRYARLKTWSDDLVDSFGPGIYTGSRHDWPLFEKRPARATPESIVRELNQGFRDEGDPLLVLRQAGNGTVHLGVDDAAKLTRRMGSFGARSYIRSTLYSLTSLPGVDCVHFHFQEGDHASPGRYCR